VAHAEQESDSGEAQELSHAIPPPQQRTIGLSLESTDP
jgi:hypothetical protein